MIYLLKFGASFVLPPGIFFVCFIALAVWCWRHRQKKPAGLLVVITLVFYVLSTGFAAEKLMGNLEQVYEPPKIPAGDVIILLGGGATRGTPDVDGTGALCGSPANRLLTAVRLQRQLEIPILTSGGQVYSDSGPEADISRRVLLGLGVPAEDILVEGKSLNTRQNAVYSGRILREHGFTHPILVTSAFHMQRAVLNFEKEGIAVTPYPTDYIVSRPAVFHYNKLAPQAGALMANTMVLQERLRMLVTRYFE